MALGNKIGVKFDKYAERAIFQPAIGSFIVEVDITAVNHLLELSDVRVIAVTQDKPVIEWNGQSVTLDEIEKHTKTIIRYIPIGSKIRYW